MRLVSSDLMVRCINPSCRKEISEQFSFCPHCGTDNRAPEQRFQPPVHKHQYHGVSDFCVVCGRERGTAETTQRRPNWKSFWAMVAAIVALTCITVGATAFATFSASKPDLLGFGAWCRIPVEVQPQRDRIPDPDHQYLQDVQPYWTTKGLQLLPYEGIGILLLSFVCFRLWRMRGYWDYEDNGKD